MGPITSDFFFRAATAGFHPSLTRTTMLHRDMDMRILQVFAAFVAQPGGSRGYREQNRESARGLVLTGRPIRGEIDLARISVLGFWFYQWPKATGPP